MMLAINLIAAGVIFVTGLFVAVNNMSRCTAHRIRLAWILLTTGALAVLLGPFYGYVHPAWSEVMLNVGAALYVALDRRKLCRRKTQAGEQA